MANLHIARRHIISDYKAPNPFMQRLRRGIYWASDGCANHKTQLDLIIQQLDMGWLHNVIIGP